MKCPAFTPQNHRLDVSRESYRLENLLLVPTHVWLRPSGGALSIVLLVRDGAVLPFAPLVQHTAEIDWDEVEGVGFRYRAKVATGPLRRPDRQAVESLNAGVAPPPCPMTQVAVRNT